MTLLGFHQVVDGFRGLLWKLRVTPEKEWLLGKVQSPLLHDLQKFVQMLNARGVHPEEERLYPQDQRDVILQAKTSFLSSGAGYARLVPDSDLQAAEVRFPYDITVYEFELFGYRMIAVMREPSIFSIYGRMFTDSTHILTPDSGIHKVKSGVWTPMSSETHDDEYRDALDRLYEFVAREFLAFGIFLDADILTHEVMRASITEQREWKKRGGKTPVRDYHVLNLRQRHARILNPSGGESGRHVRLHFRRGHWRHFETHKTWVRWCLVGDEALGFVRKDYAV